MKKVREACSSEEFASRNAVDRKFLHEFANPMAVLKYSLKKMKSTLGEIDENRQLEVEMLFARAADAIQKLENLHADFKVVVYEREIDDGQEPLDGISRRIKAGNF